MKFFAVCLISLLASVSAASAEEPTVLGQVRLVDGSAVAGAQVMLFDVSDLRRGALGQATTDADGQFALSLAGFDKLSPQVGGRGLPTRFALGQNYPNPFNPSTVIPYQLSTTEHVRLDVFNVLGQRVATLVDGEQVAGAHTAVWTATDEAGQAVSAGVYIYRLVAGDATATGRMVLVDGQAGFEPLSPQSALTSARAELVEALPEAGGSAYGLVVSGSGLVPYMDADFRVGLGPVVIEVAAQGRAKVVQDERGILGDVDNNGQVNLLDALLVAMYLANPASVLPDGSDIALGDVNGDGVLNLADAWLIGTYAYDPSAAGLPAGIGEPIASPGGGGTLGEVRTFSLPGGGEMEFVWIEAGTFMMGSDNGDWDEAPVHEVEISRGFWLGKYEVTVGQFRRFVEATEYDAGDWCLTYENDDWEERSGRNWRNPGYSQSDDHPVVCVSWEDVSAYASWLSSETGVLHRLPSEAEWEYACRAGSTTRWSFGDDESRLGDYAWYNGNNDPWGTKAVGGKLSNGWGLHDMHGNVEEWVQDWFDYGDEGEHHYNRSPRVDPPGAYIRLHSRRPGWQLRR